LDGGTLLGAYRDGDFCDDDHDDIDLTTIDPVNDYMVLNIIEAMGKHGLALYHYWKKGDQGTAQISLVDEHNLKLDLMFKEVREDNGWWTIRQGKKLVYKKVPAKFYKEQKRFEFKGFEFLIPYEVEDYLTYRYGDWKTPVHRKDFSCYTSDKAILGMNKFKEIKND